ncbi:MAG: glycosyltransferase family 2 protein [Actinomycetota bacterium]|nr:glycosyltransferase family 2 protein [Actinomycetota bacterium]
MAVPEASVVIPTLGRATRLAFALEALAVQTLDRGRFEVIVVGVSGTAAKLGAAPPGIAATFIEAPEPSASAQRNQGWRAAQAPVVAFTDDDCRPAPDWLERLIAVAAGDPMRFAQGRTEPDPDEAHLLTGSAASQEVTGESVWYETCNMAYSRRLLESLGGFDEAFVYGGEDTDLGLRALASGATREYVGDAVVWHAVHPRSLPRAIIDAPPRPTVPLVFARHPQQRRLLYLGVFWNRRHARLLVGLLGGVALGRGPRAGLAFLPYLVPELRFGLRRLPPTPVGLVRLIFNLAERFALDLAGLVTSARRSIRTRSLVL